MALTSQLRVTLLSAFAATANPGLVGADEAKPQISQEETAQPDSKADFSVSVDIVQSKKDAPPVCAFIISPDQPDKAVTGFTDGQKVEFSFPNEGSIKVVLPNAHLPQGRTEFFWRAASGIVNLPVYAVPELVVKASDVIITKCKHTLHA